jgi:hypothetical protein
VRDHDQPGNSLGADEAAQLPGQATGGAAVPHVLGEIAIDDYVVGRIGQAGADVVDHGWLPVVVVGVRLRAGAVDESDAGGLGLSKRRQCCQGSKQ